ncbi:hypothetical protein B0H10DRAFT_2004347 [Mycena sp. CBHHK59/15]|nr:hypothetical protein B0H10DRAFT_2042411 [Mycena sp. CBHHK59/15]KAJ6624839.1 hypothetical protein B0H10DRAFT_2004347 [Mycena sp. CBHHK59/15]
MAGGDEGKMLEGVTAAQHRFRLSVNVNPGDSAPPESNGSAGGNGSNGNLSRAATEPAGSGPFLYAQLPYRNSRYKEKFQALREKYDRVIAKQDEYQHDLEIATEKIKKLQAENDLLLDAMNLAAAHQPSMFGLLPPPLPPDAPSGGFAMDLDAFVGSSTSAVPLLADRAPPPPAAVHRDFSPRHVNGNGSNTNGTRSGSNSSHGVVQTNGAHPPPVEPPRPSRAPSIEFISHDMNGRAP